jgi:hypothetical protein
MPAPHEGAQGDAMKLLKIGAAIVVVLALLSAALFFTDGGRRLLFRGYVEFLRPSGDFDPNTAVAAPDYRDETYWAALPWREDPSDLVPEGVSAPAQGTAPVDVFFIHPTGYLRGPSWTSPMDAESATEENTQWMLANQASAFNGCCNVYAPRYREATIFAYLTRSAAERDEILAFAYQDVLAAFRHYLAAYNQGRPFIVASHSQGTHHAKRLIAEEIDPTPLHARLVAAYTIGAVQVPLSKRWLATLRHVTACESATQTQCIVHWDTVGDGGDAIERDEDSLCTNPLTWRVDEALAPADLHRGAVPAEGIYNFAFAGPDLPLGTDFDALDAPLPQLTWAQCRGGTLFVADQSTGPMAFSGASPGRDRNYHGLDYPLFHMDIRANAIERVARYLEASDTGDAP